MSEHLFIVFAFGWALYQTLLYAIAAASLEKIEVLKTTPTRAGLFYKGLHSALVVVAAASALHWI